MRQRQYTLTPTHVQTHTTYRLQKHLRLADHGPKCTADTLWTVLCYAGSRIISLAAACAALRDAPSDTWPQPENSVSSMSSMVSPACNMT